MPAPNGPSKMRLDRWLWAARVYKTRGLAVAAIKAGHTRIHDALAKPAHEVRPGEIITARQGIITRTLRVLGAPPARVAAKLVPQFAEELTPPEEFAKARDAHLPASGFRPRGRGRPTKHERRELEKLDDE